MRQGGTPRLWIALIRTQIKSLIFLISIGMLFILSQSGLASIYIYKVVCVCVLCVTTSPPRYSSYAGLDLRIGNMDPICDCILKSIWLF